MDEDEEFTNVLSIAKSNLTKKINTFLFVSLIKSFLALFDLLFNFNSPFF